MELFSSKCLVWYLAFGSRRKTMLITHPCLQLLLSSVVPSHVDSQQRAQVAGREQNMDIWLKLAKRISIPYDIKWKEFWREWEFFISSVVFWASWISLGVMSNCLCSTCYIHSYIYIFITIILFFFSILLNHFISTQEFYFYFSDFLHHNPNGKKGSGQTTVWCLAICWIKPQEEYMQMMNICLHSSSYCLKE